jgi:hypothetical protein
LPPADGRCLWDFARVAALCRRNRSRWLPQRFAADHASSDYVDDIGEGWEGDTWVIGGETLDFILGDLNIYIDFNVSAGDRRGPRQEPISLRRVGPLRAGDLGLRASVERSDAGCANHGGYFS